jgi:hypothetical protein
MANFAEVVKVLEQERGRLDQAIKVMRKLVGRQSVGRVLLIDGRRRRTMSAAARRRIAAAQRARWAKWKAPHKKKAA